MTHTLRILLSMVLVVLGSAVYAQEVPEMVTDRPDQTESTSLVPVGWLQVETGAVLEKDDLLETLSAGTTLVRYGLLDNLELRLTGEFTRVRIEAGSEPLEQSGLAGVSAGVKIGVAEESGVLPEIAFIGHLQLPVGHEAFRVGTIAPEFRFTFAKSLTEALGLGANLGAEWDGSRAAGVGVYTLVLGLDLSESWGVYGEVFGSVEEEAEPAHMFDAGLTFLPAANLQLDASVGVGISPAAPDHYFSVGLSFRLPR